jgi:hypothetical protein
MAPNHSPPPPPHRPKILDPVSSLNVQRSTFNVQRSTFLHPLGLRQPAAAFPQPACWRPNAAKPPLPSPRPSHPLRRQFRVAQDPARRGFNKAGRSIWSSLSRIRATATDSPSPAKNPGPSKLSQRSKFSVQRSTFLHPLGLRQPAAAFPQPARWRPNAAKPPLPFPRPLRAFM